MDLRKIYFTGAFGRTFACIPEPFLIAECRNTPGTGIFAAEYGEFSIAVHPYETYHSMGGRERLECERLIVENYRTWADKSAPDITRVGKFGRLKNVPKWLKCEDPAGSRSWLFNSEKMTVLGVRMGSGGMSFDGRGITSEIISEAEEFLEKSAKNA